MSKNKISYSDSGVNIDAGNRLVDDIKPEISATDRLGVMANIGGFGGLFDLKACNYQDPILVAATDGVGTKLKIAIETNNLEAIGQDLVAMCVNDLVVQGAEPLFFLDYYACSKLDNNQAKIVIKSIADACKKSGCALIGGETAEMPGMYQKNDFDLAGFAVGAVERERVLPQKDKIIDGDVIVSLPSSGIHSNGFSLVRKIMQQHKLSYNEISEFDNTKTYGEAFLTPTKLYIKPCLELHKKSLVKAFCHITGGGLIENIPRILPNNMGFNIDYDNIELPSIFRWLESKSRLKKEELYRVFNCGIGMVFVTNENSISNIKDIIEPFGYKDCIEVIGRICKK